MIRYGAQSIDEADVAAVVEVLTSDWLTQGPAVEAFESALCEVTGARFAVAVSSGTAALHAACVAAGLGQGDVVATSPLTFSASAACALYVGATPTLVDIDPDTLDLRPDLVPPDVDGLVAVHYAGLPLDLAALPRRPRVVIEDAAHALGARTPDGPVGSCAHSDMCCFSFHPVKPITSGEGGAVTTNDPDLAARLRRFRHHGIEAAPDLDPWAYRLDEVGANLRLTDIQSALGTSQLRRLPEFLAARDAQVATYRAALADRVVLPPEAPPGWRHGRHLFAVQVPAERRRAIFDGMRAADIGVQVHYVPLHHLGAYAELAQNPSGLPATEAIYAGLLSLPLHPGLTPADQERVIAVLTGLL